MIDKSGYDDVHVYNYNTCSHAIVINKAKTIVFKLILSLWIRKGKNEVTTLLIIVFLLAFFCFFFFFFFLRINFAYLRSLYFI